MLGKAESGLEGTELLEPVTPFDTRLLEENSPDEAMEQLRTDAAEGSAPFLFHPPVVEYHDGMDALETWIGEVGPTTVVEQVAGGGTGVVLDCSRPVCIE